MRALTAVTFLIAGALSVLVAQDPDQTRKLQLAQSLEQAGEIEQASIIYEQLVQSDSTNYVFFEALRRAYVQLKEYDKAIRLVERRRAFRPGDVLLTAQLGGLYYDRGDTVQAAALWNAAINEQPKIRQIYALIAQQMMERRLYDKAIAMYTRGRVATGNPVEFVEDLALLRSATQDYRGAVEEYLRLLRSAPQQLGYIQSRIASFTLRQDGLTAARATVASEVERSPNDIPVRTLLAWLAMEQGDYDAALEHYRVIDRVARANGSELYNFAQRSAREGSYRIAAAAYKEILDNYASAPTRPYARFGYARAVEELSAADSVRPVEPASGASIAESYISIDRSVALYEEIVRDYPNTEPAFQSMFRIGFVKYTRLFDLDGALTAFASIRRESRAGALVAESILLSSDVAVAKNDLVAAREILKSMPAGAPQEARDRGSFRNAQIAYYGTLFDTALALLAPLTSAVDRDLANDALSLQYFIAENNANKDALEAYVRAEILVRQRKHSEALVRFEEILRTAPQALLADDAMIQSAELHVALGKPLNALQVLQKIVSEMPSSIVRDRAQFRFAEICETILRDTPRAVREYERFLEVFPHSLYTEEVRKRIRSLRGDTL